MLKRSSHFWSTRVKEASGITSLIAARMKTHGVNDERPECIFQPRKASRPRSIIRLPEMGRSPREDNSAVVNLEQQMIFTLLGRGGGRKKLFIAFIIKFGILVEGLSRRD